jgi:transposase
MQPHFTIERQISFTRDYRFSDGLLEGLNSMIQAMKANARGYRNAENI